jgi:hypothetical protein
MPYQTSPAFINRTQFCSNWDIVIVDVSHTLGTPPAAIGFDQAVRGNNLSVTAEQYAVSSRITKSAEAILDRTPLSPLE